MPDWREHLDPHLAGLRLSPEREAEIIEELSQHLDQRYEELRAAGATEGEARRLALEELREPEALTQQMRSLRQAHVPPPITPGVPYRPRVRRSLAGPALRGPHAVEAARLRGCRRPHAGVGDRRQYGDLQRGVRRVAEAAAVP